MLTGQYKSGCCVLLRPSIESYINYLDEIEIDDFQMRTPEFLSKHGVTQYELMDNENIEVQPHFLVRPTTAKNKRKRWIAVEVNGKKTTIFEDEILMKGEPKITLPIFERWNLLSLVEEGESTKCPLSPNYDGSPAAHYWEGIWYALKHKTDATRVVTKGKKNPAPEIEVMLPKLTFDQITPDNIKFILGLPGVDNWKPKYYKNRIGVGYHVKVPSKSIEYPSSAWMNRTASDGCKTKSVESSEDGINYQHLFIPMERLKPIFRPSEIKIHKVWYSINWCITSFKRFFTNA